MATAGAEPLKVLDLLRDPAVRANPYPAYDRIRAAGRLVPTEFGGHVVANHAEAFAVLRDARFSSSQRHQAGYEQMETIATQLGLGDVFGLLERLMLFADPPDHTRLRRIVGKAFTPRTVEAMRPSIAATVDRLLDDMTEQGTADLVESLASKLPVTVISEMLGVPPDDHERLRGLTAIAVKALDPSDDMTVFFPAGEALREMRTYFDDLVQKRRAAPADDLLSALIAAEDEGDRLTHDELLDTTILLFGAGHETTVNLISGGVLNLLTIPTSCSVFATTRRSSQARSRSCCASGRLCR